MKRILSILLVLTMLCSFGLAFAQEEAPAEEPAEEVVEPTAEAPAEPAAEENVPAEEAEAAPAAEEAALEAETPVNDGTDDAMFPELTGLWVSAASVNAGESVEVTATATDGMTGVASISVTFRSDTFGKTIVCDLSLTYPDSRDGTSVPYSDGKLHGTAEIGAYLPSDTYRTAAVCIYDRAGNEIWYDLESPNRETLPSFAAAVSLTVCNNTGSDTTPPELTGLWLSAASVDAGESVEVTAAATDDVSGVKSMDITFCSDITGDTVFCRLSPFRRNGDSGTESAWPDGKLHGTAAVGAYVSAGTYTITGITLTDQAGNSIVYDSRTQETIPSFAASVTLTVCNNTGSDTTPPELTGLWLDGAFAVAGGSVEAAAAATDDMSGVKSIDITFRSASSDADLWCELKSTYRDEDSGMEKAYADGKLHGTVPVSEELPSGTYTISQIYICDFAGNEYWYDTDSSSRAPYSAGIPEFVSSVSLVVLNGRGWCRVGNYWYYIDADDYFSAAGVNVPADTTAVIGGVTYAFRADGTMITGWGQLSDGGWYYAGSSGALAIGWKQIGGVWYYFGSDGKMYDAQWNGRYYLTSGGAMAAGWQQIGGDWYYFGSSGARQTGWLRSGSTWYYFGSDGKMYDAQWNGNYYLTSGGAMATGWCQIGSDWYYFNTSGAVQTGWLQSGSTWYLLGSDGKMYADRWYGRYYLQASGAMATGWTQIGSDWYYFDTSGAVQTGWVKSGSSWYYLDPDNNGVMVSGCTMNIGGTSYTFNSSGKWIG